MIFSKTIKLNLHAFLKFSKIRGKMILSKLSHLLTKIMQLVVKVLTIVLYAPDQKLEMWICNLIDKESFLIPVPMLVRYEFKVLSEQFVD